MGPIVHLAWPAFPNSHLQTKAIFRWGYSLWVLLWVRPVWNLLAATCRVLMVGDSSMAVPRSGKSRLAPFQHMHRVESERPFPPPLEHNFLRMTKVFWSPLLVTPILPPCFGTDFLLRPTLTLSEVAVLQFLSFEPLLNFSFEMTSWVVLPVFFCFSPSLDFLPLMHYLH